MGNACSCYDQLSEKANELTKIQASDLLGQKPHGLINSKGAIDRSLGKHREAKDGTLTPSIQENTYEVDILKESDVRQYEQGLELKEDNLQKEQTHKDAGELKIAKSESDTIIRGSAVLDSAVPSQQSQPNEIQDIQKNIQNPYLENDQEIQNKQEDSIQDSRPKNIQVVEVEEVDEFEAVLQNHQDPIAPPDLLRRLTIQEEQKLKSAQHIVSQENSDITSFSDLKFTQLLKKGNYGKVYLSEHKITFRLYVVKSFSKELAHKHQMLQQINKQQAMVFDKQYPFICTIESIFQNDSKFYFVMPFIKGEHLKATLKSKKRFTEEQVIFYAAQLAIGIGKLHQNGLVHRNLNLENILLAEDGYIQIINYNLATKLGDDEKAQTYVGYPQYFAPEIANYESYDQNVDWWSFGVIIYEMLIGITPFNNKNRQIMLNKIKNGKVVFPDRKKYKFKYSKDISDLILKLLKVDKTKRLGSNSDYEEVLKHPVFKHINIQELIAKSIPAEIRPEFENGDELVSKNTKNHFQAAKSSVQGGDVFASFGRQVTGNFKE